MVTTARPTSTTHAPGCDRPGWLVEKYPKVWVLRCLTCHAVQLAEPDPDPDPEPGR